MKTIYQVSNDDHFFYMRADFLEASCPIETMGEDWVESQYTVADVKYCLQQAGEMLARDLLCVDGSVIDDANTKVIKVDTICC